ncbi:MAG: ABC transporter substrate-binding protein [Chloroflexota bacterium]
MTAPRSRPGSTRGGRTGWRRVAVLAFLPVVLGGCLSLDQASPSPEPPAPTPTITPGPTLAPRADDTLTVAVAREPLRFLPPTEDPVSSFVTDLLYDPLYRLDETLAPRADLAAGLPYVSEDGLTWSITMGPGDRRFQDGTALTADDVAFSLQLAQSPACTLGRDLCDSVGRYLDTVVADDPQRLTLTLTEPWQPFLAEALSRLPVVSEDSVRAATAEIRAAAASLDPNAPDAMVESIAKATNQDECLTDDPPFGCRLADHVAELESLLTGVGLALPDHRLFTDLTGTFDAETYAGELLDRVAALGRVLAGEEVDQLAASLALIDPLERPLGSGPYRLETVSPGQGVSLVAYADHPGGPPGIPRIELQVVPDPDVRATMLRTGQVDWLPDVREEQLPVLTGVAGVNAGVRAQPIQRTIVFNTRKGQVYEDAATRRAFTMCLDREALVHGASDGLAVAATSWSAPGSWAFPDEPDPPADVAGANALLDEAGWKVGADGIRRRSGKRLSSEIAIRPSRTDLIAFAQAAAEELRQCGIELTVTELDLTSDLLLRQLQWPNPFDTVLVSRTMGADPDHDMEAYSSAHITTEDNAADANPGGYSSKNVDALIARAQTAATRADRATAYAQIDNVLDIDRPAFPIWYDTAAAAISDRVRVGDAAVDPTGARYDWDVSEWSLRPLP